MYLVLELVQVLCIVYLAFPHYVFFVSVLCTFRLHIDSVYCVPCGYLRTEHENKTCVLQTKSDVSGV